jgi:hypothetical protein
VTSAGGEPGLAVKGPWPLKPARTAAYPRPVRPTDVDTNGPTVLTARSRSVRAGTPRGVGMDPKDLEVPPSSGRNGLGEERARVAPRSVSQ